MRVLFTTAWYPNRKDAGDGVFVQKHARAIARLNDVAVLMVQTDESKHDHRIEIEARDAAAVLSAEAQGTLREVLVYVPKTWREVPLFTGLVRMFWLMAGYLKGYRYIKRHYWQGLRPDICHVNVLTRAAGLPWLLSKFHHIPYIITEHWSRYARPEAYPHSQLQLRLGRRFVRDASYVCPVSLNLEQAMKKWGLDNRHYTRVSNVVDTDVFALPTPTSSTSLRSDFSTLNFRQLTTFVHVSWMRDESKNISGILRTLARLKEERQDWRMDFVGEGNDKPALIALARELGLTETGGNDHVRFLPACNGLALAQVLQQHDALLMFSNFENQPVSVLEALSCGLPVIATSVGVIPSMLASSRGMVLPPQDESQLFSALDAFLTMRSRMTEAQLSDRSLAEARHSYVADHYSPAVIARQFDALYHAAYSC